MMVAIHERQGSFSDRWIKYCEEKKIPFKIVNAFDSDIISQLKHCKVLMWHHHHAEFMDVLTAKRILFALEQAGVKVFPNFNTGWHFDDKVAQKYLLEAIVAPLVPSYVFYNKFDAIRWAKITSYPKVFKLKGGAGSTNVKLVKNQLEALKLIEKAFKGGFSQFNRIDNLKETWRKIKQGNNSSTNIIKSIGRSVFLSDYAKRQSNELGYIYFQDFIPNNDSDIRVIVIGDKAFALKRMTRENDFRASGSGKIDFNHNQIDIETIKISFDTIKKMNAQCIAFDFVFDQMKKPLIVEISYGFAMKSYDKCEGYWSKDLVFHAGAFNPQEWMVDNVVAEYINNYENIQN